MMHAGWVAYLITGGIITILTVAAIWARIDRHATRRTHAHWITLAAEGRAQAESDALWDEFDNGERMPGLDEDRKWNG